MKRRTVTFAAAVFWTAALILLSVWSLPAPEKAAFSLLDKVKHAAAYGALGLLWARAFYRLPNRRRWFPAAAGLCALAWGTVTEVIQLAAPGRSAEAGDLLADAVGIAVCITLYWWANPAPAPKEER